MKKRYILNTGTTIALAFVAAIPTFAGQQTTTEKKTEVELADCQFTPEVRKELQLTSDQTPKLEKAIGTLGPLQKTIAGKREKREQLRKQGAPDAQIEAATKELIAAENECRDRSHTLLKPILTDSQFKKVLEMEETHHHKVSGQ